MTEKPAKPTAKRPVARKPRAAPRTPKTQQLLPDHREISARAYFIHLEDGGDDELGNWLRAERELTAA
jgi:Protein of unknown function (DUF2934)